MSKRKRKEQHEEHVDESWLIPYADLLTLLLALFIVLYAMSTVDAQKFQALSQAFKKEFTGGSGIFEFPSPMAEEEMEASIEQEKTMIQKTSEKNKEEIEKEAEEKAKELQKKLDQNELANLQNKVNSYIDKRNLSDKLETSLTNEGLLVTIRDNVLFESGVAEVRKEDLKIANEISDLLVMDPPRSIIISGHTDNVPIKNAKFESNWELSVMRAINFMKIILHNDKLDPKLFSAKGYGEFQPIASNKTKEGKAKNRRVEILILPRN